MVLRKREMWGINILHQRKLKYHEHGADLIFQLSLHNLGLMNNKINSLDATRKKQNNVREILHSSRTLR